MNSAIKIQPVLIFCAALTGLLLGCTTDLGSFSASLIEPFLMVLLFCVFLSADGQKLKDAFLNLRFTLTASAVNFVWTPLFTYGLCLLFLSGSQDLQMGLMMLMVTPCTDWYLIFTGMAKGNTELGASVLPLNLLLQILLLPLYLLVFFGNNIRTGLGDCSGGYAKPMVLSIVFVLLVPFVLSLLLKLASRKSYDIAKVTDRLKASGDTIQLCFLCLAVIAMFASESRNVLQNPDIFLRLLLPLAVFFTANFLLVRRIGSSMKMAQEDITALNFTTLARNSPLSLAIAVAAFPDRPLISLALVIGPLVELPVLGLIASIIRRLNAGKMLPRTQE